MRIFIFALVFIGCTIFPWAHGITETQQQAMVEGGNLRYLWLGAIHMVTGYDHLLFLFGVIFYLTGVKDILKFVTAFTIGHSITLILATFMKVTANYFLVDAVIALSVCYKAFDNLDGFRKYLKVNPPNLLAMILVFGLIHGFGLSTRLQQLPLPEHGLLTRIISFNAGVELGQVAALLVLLLLLAGLRKMESYQKLGRITNMLLLAAGVGLFIYQINGYFHGDDHHKEESHDEKSHDAAVPTQGESEHSHGHGGAAHQNGVETYDQPPRIEDKDSAHTHEESVKDSLIHEHSHEEGHSHRHSH